ncbi:hypothetical protein SDC9_186988 [bioreactor metagenome]|uniref:Uncharacterized protein n=1 Tax=bioreactor metagenome TaxID=1076179 RepID=A0A645HL33_9ZZZZ
MRFRIHNNGGNGKVAVGFSADFALVLNAFDRVSKIDGFLQQHPEKRINIDRRKLLFLILRKEKLIQFARESGIRNQRRTGVCDHLLHGRRKRQFFGFLKTCYLANQNMSDLTDNIFIGNP